MPKFSVHKNLIVILKYTHKIKYSEVVKNEQKSYIFPRITLSDICIHLCGISFNL